ncbi:hypothetical protein FAM18110_02886 [Lacticaseibacillus paracasei]|nr:hypothetical protein FAM18110_02886 [Lacticaseibacillus paracasei]
MRVEDVCICVLKGLIQSRELRAIVLDVFYCPKFVIKVANLILKRALDVFVILTLFFSFLPSTLR